LSDLRGILGSGVRLEHIGIAADDLGHPLALLADLDLGEGREMPSGVRVARDRGVELVTPGRPGSPVERFLASRGPGLHHVALGVDDDLDAVAARLADAGIETAGPIEPGSDGRRTLFLHPRSVGGVLVELVEAAR
jgi:methylmalonyl-CoA/ethylmalonyl-CoA epimerase